MHSGIKLTDRYDDIIHLPHHRSNTKAPMPQSARAAQFAPFAALTGYDAAIAETARLTQPQRELDESQTALLNEKLAFLSSLLPLNPQVSVTFFQPDAKKDGGAYRTLSGRLKKIDPAAGLAVFTDGFSLPLDRILTLESPLLPARPEMW